MHDCMDIFASSHILKPIKMITSYVSRLYCSLQLCCEHIFLKVEYEYAHFDNENRIHPFYYINSLGYGLECESVVRFTASIYWFSINYYYLGLF